MPARSSRPLRFALLPANRRRWLAVVVIVLVLLAHLMLIEWARDSLALIQSLDPEDETVIVELHAPAAPPAPARALPPPVRRAPMVPAEPAAPAVTETPLAEAPPSAPPQASATEAPGPAASPAAAPAATQALSEGAAGVAPPPRTDTDAAASTDTSGTGTPLAPLFARVSFPPSAELSFDAHAVQGSRQLSGSGSIVWQQDGQTYSIKGEASALLLTLLSYQSSGQIGAAGILPELYHEKRIGKSATSTHFVRERKTISFSASTRVHEIQGGEQDRGSVIWQLAGLARGDPDKLEPGLAFDAIVAGSKAADRWRVQVVGKESLSLSGSAVSGWHLALAPLENHFDYQIDLWLSPDRDWYPVKIVYANRSGATLTMTLAKLNRK